MQLLTQNTFSKPWSGRESQIICGFGSPAQLGKIFPLTLLSTKWLQLCSCFVLLYEIVYRTTSACTSLLQLAGIPPWATWVYADLSSWSFQLVMRGLHKPLWLFTAKSTSQNLGENSSSSKSKDNAGRRQVIVFIPDYTIKGSRGEKHAFVMLSLFTVLTKSLAAGDLPVKWVLLVLEDTWIIDLCYAVGWMKP